MIEVLEMVLGPPGELKFLVPLFEEMLAAFAGQHGEERIIVPTSVLFLGIGERQEEFHRWSRFGAVQGDHHLIQAPDEEMHLGPQQRFAALLCSRPQNQVGQ